MQTTKLLQHSAQKPQISVHIMDIKQQKQTIVISTMLEQRIYYLQRSKIRARTIGLNIRHTQNQSNNAGSASKAEEITPTDRELAFNNQYLRAPIPESETSLTLINQGLHRYRLTMSNQGFSRIEV